jgi:UDP-perosamine 4-acetyltransferase
MIKRKLVIFPFNGNGIEALDCVDPDKFEFIGFIDDDRSKKSSLYNIFNRDVLQKFEDICILAVPGSSKSFRMRKEIINSLQVKDQGKFVSVIHSTASIGKNVQIGRNCLIMAGVVLTSNARIGDHVCILPNSIIHHDSVVEEYSLIGSKVVVAGGSRIGKNCYIGSGTNIMNGISIGDGALIGLGSNVLRNVEMNALMAGNPARELDIKKRAKVL